VARVAPLNSMSLGSAQGDLSTAGAPRQRRTRLHLLTKREVEARGCAGSAIQRPRVASVRCPRPRWVRDTAVSLSSKSRPAAARARDTAFSLSGRSRPAAMLGPRYSVLANGGSRPAATLGSQRSVLASVGQGSRSRSLPVPHEAAPHSRHCHLAALPNPSLQRTLRVRRSYRLRGLKPSGSRIAPWHA
jgi:hypothetical protein